MGDQILGLMVYCIPALVTGVIAFLFFREHKYELMPKFTFPFLEDALMIVS